MKRYALCIGNNDYSILDKLKDAVSDAQAVADKLKILGFDVDLHLNLKRDQLERVICALSDKISVYDVVFFYFAGHGYHVNNRNLIMPTDFNDKEDPNSAWRRAYPIDDILKMLEDNANKTRIIVLDACRSELGVRGVGNSFSPMKAPQGSFIAFSTSRGQKSIERNGHGLFTRFLLEHMEDPGISIETLFKRVRTDLSMETRGTQISWEYNSLIGDFQLNRNATVNNIIYSPDALAVEKYTLDTNSYLYSIISNLKSSSPEAQGHAIDQLSAIDYAQQQSDELFVIGRYIYISACEDTFACQNFIDDYLNIEYIPIEAKVHILNGMVFEIFYDHMGNLRKCFKWKYAEHIIPIVESELFFACHKFISSRLLSEDRQVFYIPGQSEKVKAYVYLASYKDDFVIEKITCNGQEMSMIPFYVKSNKKAPIILKSKCSFEAELCKKMCVKNDYLKIEYIGGEVNNKTQFLYPENWYEVFS